MSEYEQVIDEIVKHGVVVKINRVADDNCIPCERKYVGCVVELDFTEHDKVFADRIVELLKKNDKLSNMINELQLEKANVDCELYDAKKRIAELESSETVDLPFDPLECANYLINATYERETSTLDRGLKGLPDKVNSDRYTVDDLEQIAEHLLVYCKHNREEVN